jgi:hypothetical protein
MTEEEYKKLCNYCDLMLFAEESVVERFAVSFLHILREHPVFLSRYEHFFRGESCSKNFTRLCVNSLRNKITLGYRLLKSIINTEKSWFEASVDLPLKADILFVSHLLNESRVSEDIYFGDLPKKLAQAGYSVVIAYINHTGISGKKLLQKIDNKNVGIAVIPETLSFWGEIRLYYRLKRSSHNWKKELKVIRERKPSIYINILKQAICEMDSHSTVKNLRIADQVSKIAESLRTKVVITTYEGHAWERIVFKWIHGMSSKIICIGYVHAAVFRLHYSIARSIPWGYDPDVILTGGRIAKKQLEKKINSNLPIKVLGSSRIFRQNEGVFPECGNKKNICLVIPEGIWSEYLILLDFSIRCAHLCPKYDFIIRRHPLIQGKSLTIEQAKLVKAPANLKLSTRSLNDDIHDAKWALYRGSTAIIQSVLGGLMPIYLELPSEMSIDPLHEMKSNRPAIATPIDFKVLTEADNKYNSDKKLLIMILHIFYL